MYSILSILYMKPDSYAWVTLLLAKPLSLHMKKQKQLFHKFTKTCFIDNMYTFYFHLFFLLQASVKFLFFDYQYSNYYTFFLSTCVLIPSILWLLLYFYTFLYNAVSKSTSVYTNSFINQISDTVSSFVLDFAQAKCSFHVLELYFIRKLVGFRTSMPFV